jgi:N-acyl-D-glutamate deacylase
MGAHYDLVISGGLWFDGLGSPPLPRTLGIRDGRVETVTTGSLTGARTIDATGKWVMPGFIDTHTHYDAEVLVAPGLEESARHGVTTVVMGSCSLSSVYSDALDVADLFTRVEALPRDYVLPLLQQAKTWSDPASWITHLESLPLGIHVSSFIGHSDLRVAAMGLDRATDATQRPSAEELQAMRDMLTQALDAGLLGLSTMTNPWDKLDGDRFRSRPLPSVFAPWSEYSDLSRILRDRGAILQGAPNLTTKYNLFFYMWESMGLRSTPLKTTLITGADTKADPWIFRVVRLLTNLVNRLGADFRWQSMPAPFEIYADGLDLVVFEEFGSGEEARHLAHALEEQRTLLRDPAYRARFRRDADKKWGGRVWHRDFHDADIVHCPDPSLVGRSFGALAEERDQHPADLFLDLVLEHGNALRWRTTMANHREFALREMILDDNYHLSFADSGAHLRNMAFYNFPLRALKLVRDAELAGEPFTTVAQAVHALTGQLADWWGLDAGRLRVGDRADIAVVDPQGLTDAVGAYHEAPMPMFGDYPRMVRRNDDAIVATVVSGEVVFEEGVFAPGYGQTRRTGSFLRAGDAPGTVRAPTEVGESWRPAPLAAK